MRATPPAVWRPGLDRRAVRHPAPPGAARARSRSVVVVGGGIAGLAAASALAERGVRVELLEREERLGGRVRSWPVRLADGDEAVMSRGFHAFFRQYYQLRALLRRADPELRALRPLPDYPLALADGPVDSFRRVPRTPPWNLAGFVALSPTFRAVDLLRIELDAALGLLDVEFPRSREELDGVSAAEFLDRLRFPRRARHLALEVFARSFFADPREFSAGELLTMFHGYFVGSAEGLLFDVAADDFDAALWAPLGERLRRLGVRIRTGCPATRLERTPEGVRVECEAGALEADAVVLATELRPLQRLVAEGGLGDAAWRRRVAALRPAPPFAVWRRWYGRPVRRGRAEFLGTSGYGPLDNVSLVHRFEASAARWAERRDGSVVELHAYALGPGTDREQLRAQLDAQQLRLLPELAGAPVLGEELLLAEDCTAVGLEPWRERPGVDTPDPRVVLAGDGIRCDLPVALMERAATTGALAANRLLADWGVRGFDLWTTPTGARSPWPGRLRRALRRLPRRSGREAGVHA
ncbi:MAG: FAD-dependent oxidoreductase [Pseudoclavibacter sp.]|nr:FAD-dependent oxidoreductase [Pseudoclavibacter sp.]